MSAERPVGAGANLDIGDGGCLEPREEIVEDVVPVRVPLPMPDLGVEEANAS